ncbi:MAG: MCE family protein [Rhodococcus sp. (in: high G+C Gram-positive bacteria)]|uniref:MCE family protein n=1 Tax=Rhodococcus sp. TaxID=1831 RepID=UPI003BAF53B9
MTYASSRRHIAPGWWAALLVLVIVGLVAMTVVLFTGSYKRSVDATLTSERSGLVMEPGAKVKMRGIQVGEVGSISSGSEEATLVLHLYPSAIESIPANVRADIKATTAFGAKYVDLIAPADPSSTRLTGGARLVSDNVTTEVNTVFENLSDVLDSVDPAKLNATLGAVSSALRGRGDELGRTLDDANAVLGEVNPRMVTLDQDVQAFGDASGAYSSAAQDILQVLSAGSVTATTVTDEQANLDAALTSVIGLSHTGIDVLGSNQDALVRSVNLLEPTTNLLLKYNPTYTCLLIGAKWFLDNGGYDMVAGKNHKSLILDVGILAGDNAYQYPKHLPKINASGGPGGKPSCGSLPDPSASYPIKQLVTDTGWGANPGDLPTTPAMGNPPFLDFLTGIAGGAR